MTCIVGIETPDGVWMGGDSAGVSDYDLDVRADAKVFQRGRWVFGFTSSFRMGQLIRYSLRLPNVPAQGDLDKFMVTRFVDALRRCAKDGGLLESKNSVESLGTFLVGVHGHLYMIDEDLQVARLASGYCAVGCGESYAKGSMYATPRVKPEARIRTALEASERFCAGVRGPFVIVGPVK